MVLWNRILLMITAQRCLIESLQWRTERRGTRGGKTRGGMKSIARMWTASTQNLQKEIDDRTQDWIHGLQVGKIIITLGSCLGSWRLQEQLLGKYFWALLYYSQHNLCHIAFWKKNWGNLNIKTRMMYVRAKNLVRDALITQIRDLPSREQYWDLRTLDSICFFLLFSVLLV